jgi:hypothetical protein
MPGRGTVVERFRKVWLERDSSVVIAYCAEQISTPLLADPRLIERAGIKRGCSKIHKTITIRKLIHRNNLLS